MKPSPLVLVGHPFAALGTAESLRCSLRALRAAGLDPSLLDVYETPGLGDFERAEFASALVHETGAVNIYHLNADEVDGAFKSLGKRAKRSYDILYPYWELSHFPEAWRPQLQRFDEIWAPSRFVFDALRAATDRPVIHLPTACEVKMQRLLSRRHFGIPESAFAFLFFFDFRSYAARKNPQAGLRAFAQLLAERPDADTCLVLKVNGAGHDPQALQALRAQAEPFGRRVVLIEESCSDNRIKNLVHLCDAFVSLHRSEGFGRGLAEAMFLGKPVIATGYSGNLDFMDADSAHLLDYRLVPVAEGEYPFAQGQHWAEPDLGQAVACMRALLDDPRAARELGARAARHVRERIGYRTVGLAYRARLEAIAAAAAA